MSSEKMTTTELTDLQREIMSDALQGELTDTLTKFAEADLDLCSVTEVVMATLIQEHLEATDGSLQHAIRHIVGHTNNVSMMFYEKLSERGVVDDDEEEEDKPKKPTVH